MHGTAFSRSMSRAEAYLETFCLGAVEYHAVEFFAAVVAVEAAVVVVAAGAAAAAAAVVALSLLPQNRKGTPSAICSHVSSDVFHAFAVLHTINCLQLVCWRFAFTFHPAVNCRIYSSM